MHYMMLIYVDEMGVDDARRGACFKESASLVEDLQLKRQYLASAPLHPTSTATTIRVRDGKRLVTDGPYAETKEQLGGYYLIDAGNLDEAMGIAARIPAARFGAVEIRPVLDVEAFFAAEEPVRDSDLVPSAGLLSP